MAASGFPSAKQAIPSASGSGWASAGPCLPQAERPASVEQSPRAFPDALRKSFGIKWAATPTATRVGPQAQLPMAGRSRVSILILISSFVLFCMGSAFFMLSRRIRGPGETQASLGRGRPRDALVPGGRPSWEELDDARRDGWDSEVFAAKASEQWNVLGKLLVRQQPPEASDVKSLVTEEFTSGQLRPRKLKDVFHDRALQVERGEAPE